MGSEAPAPGCLIHVTGFKKFFRVDENPTEVIAFSLKDYIRKRGLLQGAKLGSVSVLETAGQGALVTLQSLLQSSLPPKQSETSDNATCDRVVWVHMGVNSGAQVFAIERKAFNEATFRCPDELGWQPERLPIISDDGEISHFRETDIPVQELVDSLVKRGFDVVSSDDAGRFVCNYVYYHSLSHAATHGTKCLFVHVPPFSKIDAGKQMEFMATLFEVLSSMLI